MKIIHAILSGVLFLSALLFGSLASAGSEPFLGEIDWVPFNFAPRGWALCDGQLLPIAQNTALFSLLGTTYGGDGSTTFALPDVRGRVMIHAGADPDLTARSLGSRGGTETETLTTAQMPAHTHTLRASSGDATETQPANNVLASPSRTRLYDGTPNVNMASSAVTNTGGSQPHDNMQPYTTLHCIIALQGVFPSRS